MFRQKMSENICNCFYVSIALFYYLSHKNFICDIYEFLSQIISVIQYSRVPAIFNRVRHWLSVLSLSNKSVVKVRCVCDQALDTTVTKLRSNSRALVWSYSKKDGNDLVVDDF